MSVREEDKQKSSCSGRGVGLAAAAIGVGVGAALYYFFSKRPENPNGEGATSGWNCERAHTLQSPVDHEESYTTISEHDTSDTSMHSSTDVESTPSLEDEISSEEWPPFSPESDAENTTDDTSESEAGEYDVEFFMDDYEEIFPGLPNTSGGSDLTEWDATSSSMGAPDGGYVTGPNLYRNFQNPTGPAPVVSGRRISEEEQLLMLREQEFRERSWSLEECSICFDIILKDQQVTTLPCTHHFHSSCITPWLQQQQTCPNCRNNAAE